MVYEYASDGSILVGLLAATALFVFALTFLYVVANSKSKSRKYADLISDMYIVGIIKQFAEKDKVDLHKELIEFNKIIKKSNLRDKGLTEVIEDEIKDKVANTQEENLSKK